jgi:hypothetical protein
MIQELIQARKISFLTFLSLQESSEEILSSVNYQWFMWLVEHYSSKDNKLTKYLDIPFYVGDRRFDEIFEKINLKEPLANIFYKDMVYFEKIDAYYPEKEYLYIPLENNYSFFTYKKLDGSFNTSRNAAKPRKLIRKLITLPDNIIVVGVLYEDSFKLLAYMTLGEFYEKKCSVDISTMNLELGKFCRSVGLDSCESYRVEGLVKNGKVKGLVGSCGDDFFNMKLIGK